MAARLVGCNGELATRKKFFVRMDFQESGWARELRFGGFV